MQRILVQDFPSVRDPDPEFHAQLNIADRPGFDPFAAFRIFDHNDVMKLSLELDEVTLAISLSEKHDALLEPLLNLGQHRAEFQTIQLRLCSAEKSFTRSQ
jgi:hypothetical protein